MPKNTLTAFLLAGTMGFIGGTLSLFIASGLFSYYLVSEQNYLVSIFTLIGILINIVGPLIFCTGFLLPLAVIDKTKIEESLFIDLVKRYTPILSLPFGLLFLFTLFQNSDYVSNKYFSVLSVVNSFCVCVLCLVFFLKKLKSS